MTLAYTTGVQVLGMLIQTCNFTRIEQSTIYFT